MLVNGGKFWQRKAWLAAPKLLSSRGRCCSTVGGFWIACAAERKSGVLQPVIRQPLSGLKSKLSPAALVLAWLGITTLLFQNFEHWSLGQSLFYAVDTGLCRLFGVVNPSSTAGKSLAVFNQLAGNVVAAVVIGKYLEQILDRSRKGRSIGRIVKCSDDDELGRICSGLMTNGPFTSVPVDIAGDSVADAIGVDTTGDSVVDTVIYAKKPMFFTFEAKLLTASLLTWLGLGVCYGLIIEHWNLITAVYFSLTTLGIGGLQPPALEGGSLEEAKAVWLALFNLVGVPLFTAANGEFVAFFLEEELRRQTIKARSTVDPEELGATSLLLDDRGRVGKAEYMLLELLRDGQTDVGMVALMEQRFNSIDRDGDGLLSRDELVDYNQSFGTTHGDEPVQ